MYDPYMIYKAILDEMDCGKEMYEKIYVEIQHEDAIWAMMYAMATDDYIVMEEITGIDYSVDRGFYDKDEEWAEYEKQICYKDYFNSLSSEEMKRKDSRDAKL